MGKVSELEVAMKELKRVYKRHAEDKLNFGDSKNKHMGISVPFWVVETICLTKKQS